MLNRKTKLLLCFIICWIGGQIGQASYDDTLAFAVYVTLMFAWLEDVHKLVYQKIKSKFS